MSLRDMERRAALLEKPYDPMDDIEELARREARGWKPRMAEMMFGEDGEPLAQGGGFYSDARPPFQTAAYPSVTLATTSKNIWGLLGPPSTIIQPSELWAGKKLHLHLSGQATSVLTPGNLTIEVRLGALTDAGGTIVATSSAIAWTASKTNISWVMDVWLRILNPGNATATGVVLCNALFVPNQLGLMIPAANNPLVIPETAAVTTTNVDLISATHLTVQWKRSGSTVETVQVADMDFVHVN